MAKRRKKKQPRWHKGLLICRACYESGLSQRMSRRFCAVCQARERVQRTDATSQASQRSGDRAGKPGEPFVDVREITPKEARDVLRDWFGEPPPP